MFLVFVTSKNVKELYVQVFVKSPAMRHTMSFVLLPYNKPPVSPKLISFSFNVLKAEEVDVDLS
jgi:hypothetical protein